MNEFRMPTKFKFEVKDCVGVVVFNRSIVLGPSKEPNRFNTSLNAKILCEGKVERDLFSLEDDDNIQESDFIVRNGSDIFFEIFNNPDNHSDNKFITFITFKDVNGNKFCVPNTSIESAYIASETKSIIEIEA